MNGNVLVYVETRDGAVKPSSLELLSAAQHFVDHAGGKIDALVAGSWRTAGDALSGIADQVLVSSHRALEHYVPEAQSALLNSAIAEQNPALVLFAYSVAGLDLAADVAVRTNRPLIDYCVKLSARGGEIEATSLIYGGKLRAVSRARLPAVAVIVPGAFPEAQPDPARRTQTVEIAAPPQLDALRTVFVAETGPTEGAVDLARAEKILCVGRGIHDMEGVDLARQLADALGAEIAGSRPVIDNGWLAKERQVGKSGRRVKPKLYLAMGVSGAPEHLEGMSRAELIIAINTDARAPIFGVAHFGTTCDLFELLPALGERLGKDKEAR
jgi:electron transfer flavoprotein alpha subunit